MTTRPRAARSVRRRTVWVDSDIDEATPSAQGDDPNLLGNILTSNMSLTLVRLIVRLDVFVTNPYTVEGQQEVGLGIGLYPLEALEGQSLANPLTSNEFPGGGWLWRTQYVLFDRLVAEAVPMLGGLVRIDMDLRAMRKVERSEIVLNIRNTALSGSAFTIRTVGVIRMLFKR